MKYRCLSCGHEFEVRPEELIGEVRPMCPKCGSLRTAPVEVV